MRRSILLTLLLALAVSASSAVLAQEQEKPKPTPGEARPAPEKPAPDKDKPAAKEPAQQQALLKAGTKLQAQLESTVDTRTCKPGDEVTARVTKDIKQNGEVVVHKGDRLRGHITDVKADAEGKSGSQLGVRFDQLVQGEASHQLNTVVTGVLSTPADERARRGQPMQEEPPMAAPPVAQPAPSGGSPAGGGLVGGVTSTVGSTANAAGSTVGGVAASAGSTVGATAGATAGAVVATPARAIHVNSQANASNQTGLNSVLSTKQGHLRLESGTQLQFRVAAESEKPQRQQQ